MIIRKDTAVRLPVRLINPTTGAAVTGMLPADISNGTVGSVTLAKSDGTTADIALVNSTNWFEVHSTKMPGLYHVLVPSSATNLVGSFALAVLPAAAAFLATTITACVESTGAGVDALSGVPSSLTAIASTQSAHTTSLGGIVTTQSSHTTSLGGIVTTQSAHSLTLTDLKDIGIGKWQVFTSGADANRLVLYRQDGSTVLKKFDLKDSVGDPTYINPFARNPV